MRSRSRHATNPAIAPVTGAVTPASDAMKSTSSVRRAVRAVSPFFRHAAYSAGVIGSAYGNSAPQRHRSSPEPIVLPHAGHGFVSPQPMPTIVGGAGFSAAGARVQPYVAHPPSSAQHDAWKTCRHASHVVEGSDGCTRVRQVEQRVVIWTLRR